MDERCRAIIEAVPRADIEHIARGAIGATATVLGIPTVSSLFAPHAEKRTIGVVKLSGTARLSDGSSRDWSSVAKLVDLSEEPDTWTRWTRPEIEEIVYEAHYFADDGTRFRPAKCYLVSRPEPGIKIFWLEDLTNARGSPFALEDLLRMAGHLGEWTGAHLELPALKFELPTDIFAVRADLPSFLKVYELGRVADHALFKPLFRDMPVETAFEFRALVRKQNERIKGHPHGLAFGDCQIGNLFFGGEETIAVDWTSLANDPVGVDGGAMIGSGLSWGTGVAEVARHERELFEACVTGLGTAGWRGKRDDVRRGYFAHFSHYLWTGIAMSPVILAHGIWPPGALAARFGVPEEDLPELLAPIVALIPGYVEELRRLAET